MVNSVTLIGHLGGDPKVEYTDKDVAIANFSLATSESYKDKEGKKVDRTEWHKIVSFGSLAEICGKYLTKGKQVYISGKIQTREWTDKQGNKRYTTEIVANEMKMLGGKGEKEASVEASTGDDIQF